MTCATAAADERMTPRGGARAWGAIYAMTLCSFVLVASEFMPISLLTPIANDLRLTEGQAGQAISISGFFAMVAALSLRSVIGAADRRLVLLTMAVMLVASGMLVAYAPTYEILMVGRAVLGLAIGGFWSMSAAIAVRLVAAPSVPTALAIVNGGNALASVIGAPAGSFIGSIIGWRGALFCVLPLAAVAAIWLALALPRLPYQAGSTGRGIMGLVRHRSTVVGFVACAMLFGGQFSLYTYLRPFLEQVTGASIDVITLLLLLIGVSGFIGTVFVGRLIGNRLHHLLAAFPAVLAAVAVALAFFGTSIAAVTALLAIWGLVSTSAPVAWWTWVTRAAPEDTEAGGGLVVAIVQFSIMAGAAAGGAVYDRFGPTTEFLCCAVVLAGAALVALRCRLETEGTVTAEG